MKRFLLTLCAVCAATFVWADTWTDPETGIEWSYIISNNEAMIGSGESWRAAIPSNTTGSIIIPSSLKGYPVTSIGESAFEDCSGLTSITIPEGVTSIGDYAFWGCSSLTSITIPEGVTSIGDYAFCGCSSLTSITIPEGVTSIGDYAFCGCSSLTSITIPEGVTSIGDYAFSGCSGLTSITILSSVTSIGEGAFSDCSSLTSITIPEGVTSIGNYAFFGCTGLTSITIPSSVTSIGGSAFSYCRGLTSVTIPSSVTSIGEYAFSNCSGLTSVTIPEGVTSIGDRAFQNCSGLTSVTIPEGVTSIGQSAFSGCSGLKEVHISDVAAWCAIGFGKDSSNPLYYAKNLYLNGELVTDLVIPEGVTSIGASAFYNCSGLTSVIIPEGVTSIGYSAFENCTGLTSITIPEGVTSIGYSAFENCTGLTSITIPEGVTSIGTRAFSDCSGLTSVTIPSSVTSIGDNAFPSVTDVSFTGNLVASKWPVGLDKTLAVSITIPSGVTSIGYWAFENCTGLTSITIPSSVTSIGRYAFDGCTGLKVVQMKGPMPTGFADTRLRIYSVAYPMEYGAEYKAVLGFSASYIGVIATADVTVSAEMTTPQKMKVTYSVKSDLPTVKVRAVAFADGVRSFAKIVPVKNGENVPLGGEVVSNTEHTFIWNVSEDWDTDLSKVAIEILVQEGDLLPQELITIPAVGDNKAMTITRNTITTKMAFNALLWCIAEGDEALTISNGVVRANGTQIASGTSVSQNANLLNYLYGKMGYKVLAGDDLTYARNATRIDFPNSGIEQRAIKIEE